MNEIINSLSKGGVYGGMEEAYIASKLLGNSLYVF